MSSNGPFNHLSAAFLQQAFEAQAEYLANLTGFSADTIKTTEIAAATALTFGTSLYLLSRNNRSTTNSLVVDTMDPQYKQIEEQMRTTATATTPLVTRKPTASTSVSAPSPVAAAAEGFVMPVLAKSPKRLADLDEATSGRVMYERHLAATALERSIGTIGTVQGMWDAAHRQAPGRGFKPFK